MIYALLFTFPRNPQNLAFRVLFTVEDDGKEASWLHSHVKSLYSVINLLFCNVLVDIPVLLRKVPNK